MDTNLTGSYIGVAGLIVMVLTHFGVNATVDQVVGIIAAVVTLYGIIHQAIVHKNTVAQVNAQ